MVLEISQFLSFSNLAWKCLFTPLWVGFWGTFSPNNVTHHRHPKRTVLGLNHVIWAIKREYRPRGSSWALEEEKRTRQEKVTKGLYFTYSGRSPHWSDLHQKLCSRWSRPHNHVCKVSRWTFRGYDFTGGRIFHFPIDIWMDLTTVQRYCAACDIDYRINKADICKC